MKTTFLLSAVAIVFASCQKQQQPLDVKYYPFCGLWGSPNHSLQIWEDGHCLYEHRNKNKEYSYTYQISFHDNTMSLSPSGHKHYNYTIVEAPHTDSLSGTIKMKLSGLDFHDGEEFIKN